MSTPKSSRTELAALHLLFCSLAASHIAQASAIPFQSNEMQIEVGGADREPNVPFVSVTVCVPGTSECQTIDHIVLDTGSTGLRLYASQLTLKLPAETISDGSAVAECMEYAAGSSWWGPVVTADVLLGGEKAAHLPIQLWDRDYASRPNKCHAQDLDAAHWGSNGILGVGPAQTDCTGDACPAQGGPDYFACANGGNGSCSLVAMPASKKVQNPVSFLKTDNNGVTISLPRLSSGADVSTEGTLYLGVGTRANNQPRRGRRVIHTRHDGWFSAMVNDQLCASRIDSGTPSWNFPSEGMGIPACALGGRVSHYLCPRQPMTVTADLLGLEIPMSIDNAEDEFAANHYASQDLAQDWGKGLSNTLILGMPFFYGRDVYFVIDGHSSSVGRGPLTAF